jgi:hypothetical protein
MRARDEIMDAPGSSRPIRCVVVGPEDREWALKALVHGFTRIAIGTIRAREFRGGPMDLPRAS